VTKMIDEIGTLAALPPVVVERPAQTVIRILDQLVHEKGPDYVYPYSDSENCIYVERITPGRNPDEVYDMADLDDSMYSLPRPVPAPEDELAPSCILGHLCVRLGTPITEFAVGGENYSGWGIGHARHFPEEWKEDSQFWPMMTALQQLQHKQDNGLSWGEAVEAFKKAMEVA